jgi:Holliday junction DNA helicase RuvA
MIATLNGEVSEKLIDRAIVDVNGLGYGIYITHEDYGRLNLSETVKLYIFEYIREQSHDLFGFLERDTLKLFEQLLNVNGVGPKMAINVLSIGSSQEVKRSIASGDVKYMQQASGVGRRVAERIVVELKDKVGLIAADMEATGLFKATEAQTKDEAVEALVALGYNSADAVYALQEIDANLPTEERIKQALKRK